MRAVVKGRIAAKSESEVCVAVAAIVKVVVQVVLKVG